MRAYDVVHRIKPMAIDATIRDELSWRSLAKAAHGADRSRAPATVVSDDVDRAPGPGQGRPVKAREPRPRATVWSQRSLIWNFAQRDLKSRYKGTAFGWAWSLMVPLATVIIYSIVFSVIFRAVPPDFGSGRPGNFLVWLMVGLVPWTFFLVAINIAIPTLLATGPLLQKIYFPAFAPVLGATLAILVQTMIEFGILAVILLIFGEVSPTWLLFPVWLCLFVLFVDGIATTLAILNVYARDSPTSRGGPPAPLLPDADHLPDRPRPRGLAWDPAAGDRPGEPVGRVHREPASARLWAAVPDPSFWVQMLLWTLVSVSVAAFVYQRRGQDIGESI